jgi:S-DNA-T family DNA segregation ATPase FtsK/SpoIIIE
MARSVAHGRGRGRGRKAETPGFRFYRQIDLTQQRLPLAGVGLVLLAALLVNWTTGGFNLLSGAREAFVGALGVGVFVVIGSGLLAGLWLLAGARRIGRRAFRRLLGVATLIVVGMGLAGAFEPSWDLGGVPLSQRTASGDLGDFLTSPFGVVLLLLMSLGGSALIAPSRTLSGLRVAWGAGRLTVRKAAAQVPEGALALPGRNNRVDPWDEELGWEAPQAAHDPAIDEHALASMQTSATSTISDEVIADAPPTPGEAVAEVADATLDEDETEEEAEAAPSPKRRRRSEDGWQMPALSILHTDAPVVGKSDADRQGEIIVDTLAQFGVDARVATIDEGPSVTQIGIEPGWEIKTRKVVQRDEAGKALLDASGQPITQDEEISRKRVRVNRITRLTNDLALALAAPSIRVLAPVPGKPVVGIEVPNAERRLVSLRGVIDTPEFRRKMKAGGLPIALGRAVNGQPVVIDLTAMPHVLIAGATGAGKSVAINSIIACLLMHFSPEEVRLVLVDPKRVELTGYNDIPHLAFSHVVTDPDEVVGVLGVVVAEMERRYRRFEHEGARNIAAYNATERTEGKLPYWVVVLDELADLMMVAPVEVEQQLVRLAQLARATGIHMVVATQRPSVDVVTGLIKANFPTRIAFATTSQTDARVIMDRAGAEKLLGKGDMLLQGQDNIQPGRVQGTFVADDEIAELIAFWTQDRFKGMPRPTMDHLLAEAVEPAESEADAVLEAAEAASAEVMDAIDFNERDTLYADAVSLAREHTRISASMLQRRLRVGYPRAARLIDMLEADGVVGAAEGSQSRLVLLSQEPVVSKIGGNWADQSGL